EPVPLLVLADGHAAARRPERGAERRPVPPGEDLDENPLERVHHRRVVLSDRRAQYGDSARPRPACGPRLRPPITLGGHVTASRYRGPRGPKGNRRRSPRGARPRWRCAAPP